MKLGSRMREYFKVSRGLRQGCVISSLLFNIFFHSECEVNGEGFKIER